MLDVPLRAVDKIETRVPVFPQDRQAKSFADLDRLVDLFEVDDLVPQDTNNVLQPLIVDDFSLLPRMVDAEGPLLEIGWIDDVQLHLFEIGCGCDASNDFEPIVRQSVELEAEDVIGQEVLWNR